MEHLNVFFGIGFPLVSSVRIIDISQQESASMKVLVLLSKRLEQVGVSALVQLRLGCIVQVMFLLRMDEPCAEIKLRRKSGKVLGDRHPSGLIDTLSVELDACLRLEPWPRVVMESVSSTHGLSSHPGGSVGTRSCRTRASLRDSQSRACR